MKPQPLYSLFNIHYSKRGQSTLEIIIALTILVAGLTSATLVFFGSQSLSLDASFSNEAVRLAEREIEKAEALARYDFVSVVSASSVTAEFTTEVIVEDLTTSTKRVTSRVSWRTDPLRLQKVELVTHVTDWHSSAASGGDTGGGGLAGDWNNPRTLGSIDLGPGNSATDLDVINKIIYMSAVASAESKPDFFIVNALDGQNPYIVSNLNTGAGLNAIDVTSDYAFVAQDDVSGQLQVIDISNKANPLLVGEFTLPGVSGTGAIGWSIFFASDRIYTGTKSATGPEFHVIDVSSPTNPVSLGSYEVGADVNEIYVSGNSAYLATSADSKELLILNVSDSGAISEAGSYNPSGSYDAKSVFLRGAKLYFGKAGGGDELRILDVSNPASIQSLGSQAMNGGVNNMVVRDTLAFLNINNANEEFQVWNISNPASTTKVSGFNFPQVANGIDYEDNLVYVAVRSNDALRIITSQ